ATTTELTAVGIVNAIEKIVDNNSINKIYLLGGGRANKYLVKRLEANLPGVKFFSVDRLGFNPDYLEAICYAIMGAGTMAGLPTVLGHVTGARGNSLGGRIIQPLQMAGFKRE
ncbi:MAG TPA: anhydro-N-acetylmuramic acid kinase, partial [candidate division Zixibacteria bacterium]|nr:anhydro-N-acetylmuramic acid kinase [candidate division Zixibacteria bacterium]